MHSESSGSVWLCLIYTSCAVTFKVAQILTFSSVFIFWNLPSATRTYFQGKFFIFCATKYPNNRNEVSANSNPAGHMPGLFGWALIINTMADSSHPVLPSFSAACLGHLVDPTLVVIIILNFVVVNLVCIMCSKFLFIIITSSNSFRSASDNSEDLCYIGRHPRQSSFFFFFFFSTST